MFKDTMTPGERMMSLLTTGSADRPGIGAFMMGFVPRQYKGLSLGECYKDKIKFAKAYLPMWELFGIDTGPLFGHACVGALEYGGDLVFPAPGSRAQSPIITRHPVETPEAVDRMGVPDPATAGEIDEFCQACKYVNDHYPEGYKSPSFSGGDPFTWAGNVVGMETLLVWMVRQPDLVHRVLRSTADFGIACVKHSIKVAGHMLIFDGGPSDSNDLISPQQFKEFALPPLVHMREGSLKAGCPGFLCHPCGDQEKNAEMWLVPPGTAGVNFDYRTPLSKVIRLFGPTTMITGQIEPAKYMLQSYEQIYKECWECLELAATHCPHGYVIGPGCELPVTTPPANLFAMAKATKDYAETKEWKDFQASKKR